MIEDGFTVEHTVNQIGTNKNGVVFVDDFWTCRFVKTMVTPEQADQLMAEWKDHAINLNARYSRMDPVVYDWHDEQAIDVSGKMYLSDAKSAAYLKLVYGGNL